MNIDRTYLTGLVIALAFASIPSWVVGGVKGGLGYSLGLGAALVSFGVLYGTVWLLGLPDNKPKSSQPLVILLVIALIAKLPLIGLAALAAYRLGEPGPGCFGVAIVLVYSAAINLVSVSGKQVA